MSTIGTSGIGYTADQLADLYDSEIKRKVTIRRRPSDPWFDQECRESKRAVRRLERSALSRGMPESIAACLAHGTPRVSFATSAETSAFLAGENRHHTSFGAPPMRCLVVVAFHLSTPSVPYDSTASLTTRLPACDLLLSALLLRCIDRCPASRRVKISSQCVSTMWSLRSVRCLTKAVHPIVVPFHQTHYKVP